MERTDDVNASVYGLRRIDGKLYEEKQGADGEVSLVPFDPESVPNETSEQVGFKDGDTQPQAWNPQTENLTPLVAPDGEEAPERLTVAEHKNRSHRMALALEEQLDAILIKLGAPRLRDIDPETGVIDFKGNSLAYDLVRSLCEAGGGRFLDIIPKLKV